MYRTATGRPRPLWPLFDTTDCPVKIAGEVRGFDLTRTAGPFHPAPGVTITQAANPKDSRKMGRFTQLAMAASLEAYGDSCLDAHRSKIDPVRMGCNIGAGMGGLPEIGRAHV